jgi:predicted glycogen debranching enzyme
MDARVADVPITPRIGKPVEVQALWIAALTFGGRFDARWQDAAARARDAFSSRFWNDAGRCLYDVIDVDHVPARVDSAVRPNQIFAVGGLGISLLDAARARAVVDCVERVLLTPCGLRSLAPGEPGYAGRYEGNPAERDREYHQGTAWPWLTAAFVEAWLEVHGSSREARDEARARFVDPLLARLQDAGLGHLSEIADGEPPFTLRGCPFQAWSLGELMRAVRMTR